MALPHVGQSMLLSDALAAALTRFQPASVVIAGCAGGNGLERVAGTGVKRVIGIDINEHYAEATLRRFGARIPGLEVLVGDIESTRFDAAAVDLVFAALLFEYVDLGRSLRNLRAMLRPGGILTAVLQLPSHAASVTPSPYRSLELLSPIMRLVPPESFVRHGEASGFSLLSSETVTAQGGKQFAVLSLCATAG